MDETLTVIYDPNTGEWILQKPFVFGLKSHTITIAIGYRFKASIPRSLWGWISPLELGMTPVLIHDYLYEHKGIIHEKEITIKYKREDADRAFMVQMKIIGVPFLTRRIAYIAVRLFGWTYWKYS